MVIIFLADGFEEVEALMPLDYLRRCELDVKTVGVNGRMVRGSHGITVLADMTASELDLEAMKPQMIILPGGMPGTLHLEQSPIVVQAINYAIKNDSYLAAICAAPSILGHMGLLEGKKATCYIGFEQELKGAMVSRDAVCVDGKLITARGAGVADLFSFKLIELLISSERVKLLKESLLCH